MTVIPAGFAQANLIFGGVALPTGAQVTLGLNISSFAGTPADAAALIGANYLGKLNTQQSSQVRLDSTLVKFGPDATGPSALVPTLAAGTLPGNAEPSQVAFLVHKVTPQGGRAGRGRFFLPGPSEADIDGAGVITPARAAALQTALDDFYDQLIVDLLGPVLLHSVGAPIVTPLGLTSLTLDQRVATQRRRLRR